MDDYQASELEALERILGDANKDPISLSYALMRSITENFSKEIGRGGFGVLYQGSVRNGMVAVKMISNAHNFSDKEFMDEINCLIRAKHKNIVRFLGYCSDTQGEVMEFNGKLVMAEIHKRLLCFEYVPNGNIQQYIEEKHHGDERHMGYKIIKGICEGLHYLHQERITHLDLKPENVMLDAQMEPKITDFGLSKCLDKGQSKIITKNTPGTLGYIAPEVINTGKISLKSDIYALGIMFVKLLTGQNYIDLDNWHKSLSMECPLEKSCIEIARTCMEHDQDKRPTSGEILDKLNEMESTMQGSRNDDEGSSMYKVQMDLLEAAMVVPVSASLGPIGTVLRQLESLMPSERSRRRKGVRPTKAENQLLRKNLAGLCKELPVAEHTMSFTAKCWMSLVRELCYDTEDCLDEVLFRSRKKRGMFLRIHRKTTKFLWSPLPKGKRKRRTPQIAKDLSELMDGAKDASERPQGFQLGPKVTIKPRLPLLQLLEEPMDKLVELLALDDNGELKQLQVVPILGFAGVGKTTIARALYQRYEGEFQYRAFLQVSRSPDLRMLLTSMLSQIKAPLLPNAFSDVQDLIDTIREHLQDKRYFIIVDDLWTASVWDTISRAFPAGCCGSRIITTTTISDVALACSSYQPEYIFKMTPLNDGQSRKLFFNCVFGSKGEAGCPKYFKPASDGIIRKCGGLPLAIVNTTSLLVSKPNFSVEKWELIQDSIPSTLRTHPTSEGMKEVVEFSYNNLPLHLKTCLLYLTMYPEGYTIRKDELMNQWVAEGFVAAVEGLDKEETAGAYFDELVCRGMIQPVDTKNNDEVLSCTLHHIVLDIIRCDVMEENFITTVNYLKTNLGLADKVRRLSVQFGGAKSAKIPASLRLSQVRSLFFCGFFKVVPSITDYELLRVLILQIWADQDERTFDLTRICKLFRLRYLKIECNMTVKLPDKIQGLQCLGALQVDARLSAIPSDIVHLQNLLHLRIPSNANLPAGIGRMISLRTLGHFDLSTNSADNVMDLGELTNLQDLHLTCSTLQPADNLESNMKRLGFILGKLVSLRCLTMTLAGSSQLDSSSWSISYDAINKIITKNIRGTSGYIAPEVINTGKISLKSDIDALGIMFVKLLTGQNYIDFDNWHKSLSMECPLVKSCIEIARTCMEHDQDKRPTAGEILDKLNEMESTMQGSTNDDEGSSMYKSFQQHELIAHGTEEKKEGYTEDDNMTICVQADNAAAVAGFSHAGSSIPDHDSLKSSFKEQKRVVRKHILRPLSGASPYTVCNSCFDLVQMPSDIYTSKGKIGKMQCGQCSEVIVLSHPAVNHANASTSKEVAQKASKPAGRTDSKTQDASYPVSISESYEASFTRSLRNI